MINNQVPAANDPDQELAAARTLMEGVKGVYPILGRRGSISFECKAFINGRRQGASFNSAKYGGSIQKAAAAARAWLSDANYVTRVEGTGVMPIPPKTRRIIEHFQHIAEELGVSLREVFEVGVEEIKKTTMLSSVTFATAKDEVIRIKDRAGISPSYLRDIKRIYGNFAVEFGGSPIASISAEAVEEWLYEHGGGSPVTFNNLRRYLATLWNIAAKPRYGWVSRNVVADIEPRKVDAEDVEVLTVYDATQLLQIAHARFPRVIPYLALGMFAGLRISECLKAQWEDIDWERGVVMVRGKVRTMARRPVDLEPVFVDWVKPLTQEQGPICTPERTGDIAALRAGTYRFGSNVFRHSFGSYHWGAFQNPQKTMMEMGHTSLAMLTKYYRKPLPEKIARPFWNLFRSAVLSTASSKQSEGSVNAPVQILSNEET